MFEAPCRRGGAVGAESVAHVGMICVGVPPVGAPSAASARSGSSQNGPRVDATTNSRWLTTEVIPMLVGVKRLSGSTQVLPRNRRFWFAVLCFVGVSACMVWSDGINHVRLYGHRHAILVSMLGQRIEIAFFRSDLRKSDHARPSSLWTPMEVYQSLIQRSQFPTGGSLPSDSQAFTMLRNPTWCPELWLSFRFPLWVVALAAAAWAIVLFARGWLWYWSKPGQPPIAASTKPSGRPASR